PQSIRWKFERRFPSPSGIRSAIVRVAADGCNLIVSVNGQKTLQLQPFSPTVELQVAQHLRAGENRIEVLADSTASPAAFAASLLLRTGSGEPLEIVTDEDWRVTPAAAERATGDTPATSLGLVAPELWGLNLRPATIDPFDNYEQWRQALGDAPGGKSPSFWTAPEFEITLLRSAQPEEGSWVSLAFDPRGRLTIAREDKGLLRMTLDADSRAVAKVEAINDELLECRGLLYAYDALYANANNSKGLYRLRDADGNDQFDDVQLLREFPGGVGHGRNDLALGLDGLIYSIHGDAVDVPTADIADRTTPFRNARRGQKTSEGCLLRTDQGGKEWELVCGGMRNPFGIAFNAAGDLFTYDADAEFDMGTPWYRPTRVLQLRSGADFGWRGVTGNWPPYFPDQPEHALPALDIGKGSPTAVAFGSGSKFPPPYQGALFILDWAYGRVLAVHLAPRGAGYRSQAETFLKGRPLNVTDLAFGPDGAMYLVTGGRKTQSALYRVAYVGQPMQPPELSRHEQLCQSQAIAARKLLRELEALHRPSEMAVEKAWPHLDAADPVIRHAARIAIEHQPVERWRDRAWAEKRTNASLEALLALAGSGETEPYPQIIERLLAYPFAELNVSQSLALLRIYQLCWEANPESLAPQRTQIVAQLDAAFAPAERPPLRVAPGGTSNHVQRDLARLLVQLGSPTAVEKTVRTFLRSDMQEDRLYALFVLRHEREGWTLDMRREYFAALNEGENFLRGEGMPRFLTQLREEATQSLAPEERKALGEIVSASVEAAEADLLLPSRAVVKAWTIDDFKALLSVSPPRGDATRGEAVFREALCARCHRVGARGPAVGPDLTHVAGRFSRQDILESILTPSKVVAENYRNVQVVLMDGQSLVGRVLNEGDYRSETLRLAPDPLRPSHVVEINKRDIERYQLSETSPMPKGLLDTFTAEEVLDLLAHLRGP
ncbi:MAG TPA: c-type cytochrome, partial [Pirellulaceae bacterium]|nr:c-type cytochrome [Pirellulaceae bacterium]